MYLHKICIYTFSNVFTQKLYLHIFIVKFENHDIIIFGLNVYKNVGNVQHFNILSTIVQG
jgi:hypothetical protein